MAAGETDPLSNPDLLTVEQVAKRLSMSVRSLWRLIKRGKFPPPIRFSRKMVRWTKDDLASWVGRQRPAS